jgi:benzoyl-CoA reductase subunit B
MTTTDASLAASKARHQQLTQLNVTHTLRRYQREWFARLRNEVLEEGKPFVITGANAPHEFLEALDIAFMTNVWYSGLIGARRQSGYYSEFLERAGYHSGLSRYGSLLLGVAMDDDGRQDPPWGGYPPPQMVISSPPERGAEELARFFGVPYVAIPRPIVRAPQPAWWDQLWNWEDAEESYRIDYMTEQFRDLIGRLERIAGRRMDYDRLAEVLAKANEQAELFRQVRHNIATAPKLPVRLAEVMSQVMGIQWHRGTDWAVEQARAFAAEVQARTDAGQWVCPNERFRLMYLGAGLWQQLDFFASFEDSHGVVFARSNYLSIACDGYPRYGRDPVRALAARYVTFNDRLHLPPWAGSWAVWEAHTHRLCGGIQLDSGLGQKFITHALEAEGLPVLQLPVDAVDTRSWDEEKMRALVTDFIERRLAAV